MTQVKAKILDAVYKNTPFSLRPTIDEVRRLLIFEDVVERTMIMIIIFTITIIIVTITMMIIRRWISNGDAVSTPRSGTQQATLSFR